MKKYVKPMLIYERFELSKHIADCAWDLQADSDETCNATADEDKLKGYTTLFNDGNNTCDYKPGMFQNYCYFNGAQSVNVFKS